MLKLDKTKVPSWFLLVLSKHILNNMFKQLCAYSNEQAYKRLIVVGQVSMEQRVFAFSLIIEGTTEKVLQFIMPLKSINNRNFGFIEQKMYFLTLQRDSSKKNY